MTNKHRYDYDIITPLLHGWLGPMFHVKKDQENYRLYNIQDLPLSVCEDLHLRIQNMETLDHPNLPALQFINEKTLVTPYQESVTVEQLIQSGHHLSTEALRFFARSSLSLLQWAHQKERIHGDLHSKLIYISNRGEIFIEGFGRKPEPKQYPHTGHHRYLPPEPFGSISGDIYALGVIVMELLLERHLLLGDILEESHRQRVQEILQQCSEKDPLIVSFIQSALQFHPDVRQIPEGFDADSMADLEHHWRQAYPHFPFQGHIEPEEVLDPIDIVFHSEEFDAELFLPTQEELDLNELTEDLLPPEPFEITPQASTSTTEAWRTSLLLLCIFLGVIIVWAIIS